MPPTINLRWRRRSPADPKVRQTYPVLFVGPDNAPLLYVRQHPGIDDTVRWLQLAPELIAAVCAFLDLEDGTVDDLRGRLTRQDELVETLRQLRMRATRRPTPRRNP